MFIINRRWFFKVLFYLSIFFCSDLRGDIERVIIEGEIGDRLESVIDEARF